jgi:putative ABC transport system permease protein
VLRKALVLAGAGITIGLGISLVLSRFLESLLYDVTATDPLTFVAVPALLGLIALAAAWIPARRAVAVSPRDALVWE